MALATQCPHCYTSFRVANDQLKLHAGMVRCGACKHTFNGIEHLLAPGEAPRTPPSQEEASTAATPIAPAVPEEGQNTGQETAQEAKHAVEIEAGAPALEAETTLPFDHTAPSSTADESLGSDSPASTTDLENDESETTIESETPAASDVTTAAATDAVVTEKSSTNSSAKQLQEQADEESVPEEFAEYLGSAFEKTGKEEIEEISSSPLPFDEPAEEQEVAAQLVSEEHSPNQQELDDIALFQEKLASFAAMVETPSTEDAIQPHSEDLDTAEHYSSQLELIDAQGDAHPADENTESSTPELDPVDLEASAAEMPATKAQTSSLTASLDFELSDEERTWQESAELSQIEVETKAVIAATDDKTYSRHEPVFSDDTVLEDDVEQDLQSLLDEHESQQLEKQAIKASPPQKTEPSFHEPSESTTDHVSPIDVESEEQPDFMVQAERAHRYEKLKTFGLILGVLILLLAATAQTVYFMRSTIAAQYPASKPHLQKMCAQIGCEIKLPTQIENIVVEGTELTTLSQEPHVLQLAAQFRNKSNTAQAWPMLELVLKDSRNRPVLQRVFKPEEYLETPANVTKGFAANSESAIKVHFELSTAKAANYAVEVFYP
ncbi:DUF3426 domain-containing protein [Undibacterium cyanobacteriorum]|uniref:DUF3426 domain-containing protein n=1 Tax=Undibacterium cyanobacteriorum TaxID=3073561 RepID=A0ABY9RE23_9BURK|nr:DUF3426 domain-containing protein [Undibacterium sp. 20NA77.5]WMW79472.1 DUF3426 domain-containing protein [Undibacterium sp. 20NA77.5]